jgi:hypothetical protein
MTMSASKCFAVSVFAIVFFLDVNIKYLSWMSLIQSIVDVVKKSSANITFVCSAKWLHMEWWLWLRVFSLIPIFLIFVLKTVIYWICI